MSILRVIFLFLIAIPLSGREVFVSNADQLEDALSNIQIGDTVWVNDGLYNDMGSLTLKNLDASAAPILISAVNIGQARFSAESYFDLRQCSYVTIRGFLFTSTDVTVIKLQASSYIRITQNIFRLNETESLKWIVVGGIWNDPYAESHHNRIDYNLFEEKHKPGNFITIDGSSDPVYKSSQYDRIDHNHFKNIGPRVQNEMEAVRVGWSELSLSSGFTVVEYNLFENCDGDPEIISVKTCDDTVRFNTFRSSQGTLSLRHGNRSVVDGNFFFGENKPGTGGVRIYGNDHKITNNYFQDLTGTKWDAAITLTNGDYDGGGSLSKHFRINRALVSHNTLINNAHNFEIGFTNNGKYSKPPRDVIISNNVVSHSQNDLVVILTEPLNMTWVSNIMFAGDSSTIGISIDSSAIYNYDPLLVPEDDFFRPTAESILIDYLSGFSSTSTDIEKQPRDQWPDVGCDEVSSVEIKNKPLNAEDVGPFAEDIATVIIEKSQKIPRSSSLKTFPNPFNPTLNISFELLNGGFQNLHIYDISGRQIKDFSGFYGVGQNHIKWDAGSNSSGLYIVQLNAINKKVLLVK